ncbi:MAG: amino acid permease [Chitinophagaceae bacterium]|nr:amino acid permease [Chitinophagaceae bacterium]
MEEDINIADRTKIPLNRVIGLATGILMVAGIMIGSGVFKKIAPMSALGLNGTYILAAWIVAGIITMFGAFTIAGLATMTTESGGQYEYLRLMFGNFISFLFGWSVFTIIGSAAIAALAFIFSQSVNALLPVPEPFHALKDISIANFIYPFAGSGIKIFAITSIILLTWVNYRGTKKGAALNNVFTFAKIFGILALILLGLSFSTSAPIATVDKIGITDASSLKGTMLFSAFFSAMLSAFWAYDGWINVAYLTGEIKNPKRNVPVAIITGVSIVIILYVLVNYAYMKVLPLKELAAIGENEIIASAVAGSIMGSTGKMLITILVMVSSFGALNAIIIAYPRLYYKMALEKVFFKNAANVHPTYRTPYISLIYSMLWSSVLVITGTFDLLTDLIIFASFLFYGLLSWGLIKMKRKKIITARVVGYPVIPMIIILFSFALTINTVIIQPKQSAIGMLLVLSGIPFYYYFRRRNEN